MPKGVPNKRYTPEIKKLIVETMLKEKLSHRKTARQFEVNDKQVAAWERIYLTEGPEGFAIERRDRVSEGRPPKKLPKEVKEDVWPKCSGGMYVTKTLCAERVRLRARTPFAGKEQSPFPANLRACRCKSSGMPFFSCRAGGLGRLLCSIAG